MPSIIHRLTIDAPAERLHELVATASGVQSWWTGRPVAGETHVGGRLSVFFGESDDPAATFEIAERDPSRVVWRCVQGPGDWIGTQITYRLQARDDGGVTLLFSHEGWRQESEFMAGCSTNWAAYLMSLKSGAEGHGFRAYPAGEVNRWA
ncbi:MAG TPA: SRPBCC domain-containing protein [Solirubrobacteraceae bacterium]|nr:SRPBCC domain-containing protein [Solirubrobacteraceae bacterium]